MELRGKTAVVTGGASGIGRALILRFAREGANVVVADLDEPGMAAVAGEAQALGVKALAVRTDVTEVAQVQALAARAFEAFGAVHVLCNNAGVAAWGALETATHLELVNGMSQRADDVELSFSSLLHLAGPPARSESIGGPREEPAEHVSLERSSDHAPRDSGLGSPRRSASWS